jgi:hypothetical protein
MYTFQIFDVIDKEYKMTTEEQFEQSLTDHIEYMPVTEQLYIISSMYFQEDDNLNLLCADLYYAKISFGDPLTYVDITPADVQLITDFVEDSD